MIGVLSLKLALGTGGTTESQNGALQTIANQSFGMVLLIALAVGLAGYAIWRLIDGFGGARREAPGTVHRVAAVGSGLAYGVLCYVAVQIIVGANHSNGSPRHAASGILGWPGTRTPSG